ncbi:hypothetical protein l11_08270 [Neisseria weaveri LMG 5135]|nr:hypothetical protein l13_07520 [Neisseria weaveri ATCC 51223]EGV37877.1 hypothetical protein l11_08270 [Neisseria weaveri LMG 5135]
MHIVFYVTGLWKTDCRIFNPNRTNKTARNNPGRLKLTR